MKRNLETIYLLLLVAAGAMRFLNLGFLDLQAWDEALYALRSEAILRYGVWLDQSKYAVDGLYSALHPPLYVWLTALSFQLFHISEFSARFFSAIFGLLTLPIIYSMGRRIANAQIGIIAALLFALNPFVSFYARQGQFDTTLVFFLSLSVLLLIKREQEDSLRMSFYAGLATGAALMTKVFVGLGIPLSYVIWIMFQPPPNRKGSWKALLAMLLGAALVTLPWHVYMTVQHGKGDPLFFLTASAIFERSVEGVEGNVKPLEVLYFVNQLFVLFPLGVIWFGYGFYRLVRMRESKWYLFHIWFAVFFLVFSLMRTKLAVYLLPMLVPASLIAANEIWLSSVGDSSRKERALLIGGTLISLLWASSQNWRNEVKSLLNSLAGFHLPPHQIAGSLLIFLALVFLCVFITTYLWQNDVRPKLLSMLPILFLAPAALWSLYNIVSVERTAYKDGMTELAQFVKSQGYERIVVAGYERNPQLTYYLDGADIGWRDDLNVRRIIPPHDRHNFRSWLIQELTGEPDESLIVLEKDKFIRYETIDPFLIVPPDYVQVFESRRYAAFQRGTLINLAIDPIVVPQQLMPERVN